MKVVIYVVCFFVMSLIQSACRVNGIILGAIPTVLLYLGTFWLARALCKAWDNRS